MAVDDAGARGCAHPEYGHLVEAQLSQAAGYARSLLRHHADAEDAVQQAVLRGMERFATYDTSRPFKGWWFAVLRNVCLDALRARRKHRTLDEIEMMAAPARADQPASWEGLALALDRLEDEHASILRLRYFGELSYDELSQALGIPRGTVMSRLHYARIRLAAAMTKGIP